VWKVHERDVIRTHRVGQCVLDGVTRTFTLTYFSGTIRVDDHSKHVKQQLYRVFIVTRVKLLRKVAIMTTFTFNLFDLCHLCPFVLNINRMITVSANYTHYEPSVSHYTYTTLYLGILSCILVGRKPRNAVLSPSGVSTRMVKWCHENYRNRFHTFTMHTIMHTHPLID